MVDELLAELRNRAENQKVRRLAAETKLTGYTKRLVDLEKLIQRHHEAKTLFLEGAKFSREKTVKTVQKNTTNALRAIFEDRSIDFLIEISEKRGALDADFQLRWERDGILTQDSPMRAKGGSYTDVITTALRVIFLNNHVPKRRPILFLDEPGKFMQPSRRARYATWITKISHDLGMQIFFITHDPELKAVVDRLYTLTQNQRGETQVQVSDGVRDLSGYGFKEEHA
jgi:DNA repair exonuclease SbcCD ATPase subunit